MNERDRRLLQIARNSEWLAAYARKDRRVIQIESYFYNVTFPVLRNNATGQGIIQIQADSDFVVEEMSGAILDTSDKSFVLNPAATVQVTDSGSGKTFFNAPTLFGLVFGLAGFPYFLSSPRIIAPNTNVIIDATNMAAAVDYTIYISLNGVRIYYAGPN